MSSNTVLTGGSSDFFSAVFSSWLHSYSVRPAGKYYALWNAQAQYYTEEPA